MVKDNTKAIYDLLTRNNEKAFIEEINKLEEYKKNIGQYDTEKLIMEKNRLLSKTYKKGFSSDMFSQIIALAISILLLIVSLSYYTINDISPLLGYNNYFSKRIEQFQSITGTVSNLRSEMLKENELVEGSDLEKINNLIFYFTSASNDDAYNIIIDDADAFDNFETSYIELLNHIEENNISAKYYTEFRTILSDFDKMNQINKDIIIYSTKSEVIQKFMQQVGISMIFVVFLVASAIFILLKIEDWDTKLSYIYKKRIELIDSKLLNDGNDTHENSNEKKVFISCLKKKLLRITGHSRH